MGAIEIKLGVGHIDEAASNLLKFKDCVDITSETHYKTFHLLFMDVAKKRKKTKKCVKKQQNILIN